MPTSNAPQVSTFKGEYICGINLYGENVENDDFAFFLSIAFSFLMK